MRLNRKSSVCVAIADDSEIIRIGLKFYLGKHGYRTSIEANNGYDLIKKLEDSETIPEVCFMDVEMPEMNGIQATEVIKTRWPDIKIIAHSSNDDKDTIIKMLQKGASGYVRKGGDMEELDTAISTIKAKGFYLNDIACKKLLYYIRINPKNVIKNKYSKISDLLIPKVLITKIRSVFFKTKSILKFLLLNF